MAESYLPNPSSTIIYFMLITICFIFFTIFNIFQTNDIKSTDDVINNNIFSAVYILLLVVGSYFINATISKSMCSQSIQWSYVLMITLLPWIIIFVSLYFILKIFPGWITPFSNTIGYAVIGFLGVEKIYDSIFINSTDVDNNSELVKAIANMNSNKTKFINQISTELDEFYNFFNNIKDALKPDIVEKLEKDRTINPTSIDSSKTIPTTFGTPTKNSTSSEDVPIVVKGTINESGSKITETTEQKDDLDPLLKLYQLLVIKQVIGKIVWYILAGILISSISYNLVISMACEKSLEEIQKDFEDAREEAEQSITS